MDNEFKVTKRLSENTREMIFLNGASLDSIDTDSLEVVIDKIIDKTNYSNQKINTVMHFKMGTDFVMSAYTLDQDAKKEDMISFSFVEYDPLYQFLDELIENNNSMRIFDDKNPDSNKYVEFRKEGDVIHVIFFNDKNEDYKWYITVNKNGDSKLNKILKVKLYAFFINTISYFYEEENNKRLGSK